MEATIKVSEFPINASNAAELQKKGVETRKANKLRQELLAEQIRREEQQLFLDKLSKQISLQPIQSNPLHVKITEQIDKIDLEMEDCDASALVKLAQAKATLWKLLFPQPKASRSRRDFTPAEPIE